MRKIWGWFVQTPVDENVCGKRRVSELELAITYIGGVVTFAVQESKLKRVRFLGLTVEAAVPGLVRWRLPSSSENRYFRLLFNE